MEYLDSLSLLDESTMSQWNLKVDVVDIGTGARGEQGGWTLCSSWWWGPHLYWKKTDLSIRETCWVGEALSLRGLGGETFSVGIRTLGGGAQLSSSNICRCIIPSYSRRGWKSPCKWGKETSASNQNVVSQSTVSLPYSKSFRQQLGHYLLAISWVHFCSEWSKWPLFLIRGFSKSFICCCLY